MTARDGGGTIVIDDATGYPGGEGIKLSGDVMAAIKAAGLTTTAPDRGLNGYPGAYNMPGVQVANVEQQAWFTAVATKVLLPRFKDAGKPFVNASAICRPMSFPHPMSRRIIATR